MIQNHSSRFMRLRKTMSVILAASIMTSGFLMLPNNESRVYADVPETIEVSSKELPPFDPNIGGEGIKGFIGRLYLLGLGREIVVTDNNYYLTEITSGRKTGGQVAKIILQSNEFKSFNYSDEDFIEILYRIFFNRQAAGAGRDYWLGVLARVKDRGRLIDSFVNSVEWITYCDSIGIASGATVTPTPKPTNSPTPRATNTPRPTATNTPRPTNTPTPRVLPPFDPNIGGEGIKGFIGRLYALGLGRSIVVTDSNYYLTEITSGRKTGGQVAKIILTSNEFRGFNYSDEDFVEVLYRIFFNRQAAGGGKAYWLGVLAKGTDRSRVIDSFINSVEWVTYCDTVGIASGATITPTPKPTLPPVVVASFDEQIGDFLEIAGCGDNVVYVQYPMDQYTNYLDNILASGENVPDVYACDADYAQRYFNSSSAMSMSDLGITDSELSNMYQYTLNFATGSDGEIYGLTYDIQPGVVFYNRTVAQQTLGVSSPEAVAPYFANWDAFMNTVRTVNSVSNGTRYAIPAPGEIYRFYMGSRTTSWFVDGELDLDNPVMGLFDITYELINYNLTPNSFQWTDSWNLHATDHKVLSYWGPMWFGEYALGLGEWGANPTKGEWNVVQAPSSTFWGGTWLIASPNANVNAAASVLRAITIDRTDLTKFANNYGIIPNNMSLNQSFAQNSNYATPWLNNQNVYGILDRTARGINTYYNYNENLVDGCFAAAADVMYNGVSVETAVDIFAEYVQEISTDDGTIQQPSATYNLLLDDTIYVNARYICDGQYITLYFTTEEEGYYTIYSVGDNDSFIQSNELMAPQGGNLYSDDEGEDMNFSLSMYFIAGTTYSFRMHLFNNYDPELGDTGIVVVRGRNTVATPTPTNTPSPTPTVQAEFEIPVNEAMWFGCDSAAAEGDITLIFTPEYSGNYVLWINSDFDVTVTPNYQVSGMTPIVDYDYILGPKLTHYFSRGMTYTYTLHHEGTFSEGLGTTVTINRGYDPLDPAPQDSITAIEADNVYAIQWSPEQDPFAVGEFRDQIFEFTPATTGEYTFYTRGECATNIWVGDGYSGSDKLSGNAYLVVNLQAGQTYYVYMTATREKLRTDSTLYVYTGRVESVVADPFALTAGEIHYIYEEEEANDTWVGMTFTPTETGYYHLYGFGNSSAFVYPEAEELLDLPCGESAPTEYGYRFYEIGGYYIAGTTYNIRFSHFYFDESGRTGVLITKCSYGTDPSNTIDISQCTPIEMFNNYTFIYDDLGDDNSISFVVTIPEGHDDVSFNVYSEIPFLITIDDVTTGTLNVESIEADVSTARNIRFVAGHTYRITYQVDYGLAFEECTIGLWDMVYG